MISNPADIMLDEEDVLIIIDFESCQREGDLSFGIGIPGWTNGSMQSLAFRSERMMTLD